MIPVEYFWFALIFMLGIIGAVRGLSKELGVTTLLTLSLFVLKFVWSRFQPTVTSLAAGSPLGLSFEGIRAIVFSVVILFVAFISYEGFVLTFPFKEQKGFLKGFFGFVGGLLNGYLVIGTVWYFLEITNYPFPPSILSRPEAGTVSAEFVRYLPLVWLSPYLKFLLPAAMLLVSIMFV